MSLSAAIAVLGPVSAAVLSIAAFALARFDLGDRWQDYWVVVTTAVGLGLAAGCPAWAGLSANGGTLRRLAFALVGIVVGPVAYGLLFVLGLILLRLVAPT